MAAAPHRGITVLAVYKDSDYVGEVLTKTYSFTDAAGGERTFSGSGRLMATDPDRIEMTYAPYAPERMTARKGPAVRTLSFLAYALLGLPVTAATAAYPTVSLFVLLSALQPGSPPGGVSRSSSPSRNRRKRGRCGIRSRMRASDQTDKTLDEHESRLDALERTRRPLPSSPPPRRARLWR